jgi:hypothetical protein
MPARASTACDSRFPKRPVQTVLSPLHGRVGTAASAACGGGARGIHTAQARPRAVVLKSGDTMILPGGHLYCRVTAHPADLGCVLTVGHGAYIVPGSYFGFLSDSDATVVKNPMREGKRSRLVLKVFQPNDHDPDLRKSGQTSRKDTERRSAGWPTAGR